MKNTYVIDIIANTGYIIKASSKEEAIEKALDYFEDYQPSVYAYIDNDEEPEIEI